MIGTSVALSVLTTSGVLAIYAKLPKKVRKFLEKHALATDVLTLIGTYYLLGGTLTALFAASICGLTISALLHISKNKQHFLYLYDVVDLAKKKLSDISKVLIVYGEEYKKNNGFVEEVS